MGHAGVEGTMLGAGVVLTKKDDIYRDLMQELKNVTAGDIKLDDYITKGNIVLAGYSFAGLAGLQILAMMLAYFHRSHLIDAEADRIDLEDGYEQLDGALIDRERGASRARTSELPPRGDRGDASETEAQATTSKFRSKYANLYEKYGITPKD